MQQSSVLRVQCDQSHPRRISECDRIGIVLFHWGGPNRIKNVHSFLRHVYDDHFPVNRTRLFKFLRTSFSWLAAAVMCNKVEQELAAVGGICPASRLVDAQVRGLEDKLIRRWGNKTGINFRVYAATRYSTPSLVETANQMKEDGIDHVILIPSYLQESNAGMKKSIKHWLDLSSNNEIPHWPTYEIPPFGHSPGVLNALNERIDQALQRFPKPYRSDTTVIFCAPGIPGQDKNKFQKEVFSVGSEVMRRRKEQRPWYTAFYGYYGPIGDHLRELKQTIFEAAHSGNRCVLLLPLCGTTENLQTTYSMDIACRDYAKREDIHHFEVAKALNCNVLFLETLSNIIGEAVHSRMSAD